jgi:putative hydrolase of the HAD superfamily
MPMKLSGRPYPFTPFRASSSPLPRGEEISFVFFDFAGTLVEGVPNWEHPQIIACREAGLEVTPSQVKAAIWAVWGPLEGCAHVEASTSEMTYCDWIGAIERRILEKLGVPASQLDEATNRVMELQVSPECYRIFPDVTPTLARLREAGLHLGLISNFAWRLPELADQLGLAAWFDLVVTSAQVGYRKPRPEIFAYALNRLGARATESLYVGDDPICDRDGARAAGLTSLLLARHQRSAPKYGRIRTLEQLAELLGCA